VLPPRTTTLSPLHTHRLVILHCTPDLSSPTATSKQLPPKERLPIYGRLFEQQLETFVTHVLEPEGFELEVGTRIGMGHHLLWFPPVIPSCILLFVCTHRLPPNPACGCWLAVHALNALMLPPHYSPLFPTSTTRAHLIQVASRVPYLCQGDLRRDHYELDDAVVVIRVAR